MEGKGTAKDGWWRFVSKCKGEEGRWLVEFYIIAVKGALSRTVRGLISRLSSFHQDFRSREKKRKEEEIAEERDAGILRLRTLIPVSAFPFSN